jgi:hypothetical protein
MAALFSTTAVPQEKSSVLRQWRPALAVPRRIRYGGVQRHPGSQSRAVNAAIVRMVQQLVRNFQSAYEAGQAQSTIAPGGLAAACFREEGASVRSGRTIHSGPNQYYFGREQRPVEVVLL